MDASELEDCNREAPVIIRRLPMNIGEPAEPVASKLTLPPVASSEVVVGSRLTEQGEEESLTATLMAVTAELKRQDPDSLVDLGESDEDEQDGNHSPHLFFRSHVCSPLMKAFALLGENNNEETPAGVASSISAPNADGDGTLGEEVIDDVDTDNACVVSVYVRSSWLMAARQGSPKGDGVKRWDGRPYQISIRYSTQMVLEGVGDKRSRLPGVLPKCPALPKFLFDSLEDPHFQPGVGTVGTYMVGHR